MHQVIENKNHPNQKINYQNISIFKIISPIWPNFSLSPNVPNVELETLGLHRLDVEALCRGDVSGILWGQGFQDCCFTSIVLGSTKLINIMELWRILVITKVFWMFSWGNFNLTLFNFKGGVFFNLCFYGLLKRQSHLIPHISLFSIRWMHARACFNWSK